MQVSITKTWNDLPIDHKPVMIEMKPNSDDQSFQLIVTSPFFNDPAQPAGAAGQPFFGLWEYEVVELFLANDENQYVEIELSPWGQHLVLLLNGVHNTIHHSLPLQFEVENRGRDEWRGRAIIPLDYLPPQVTKMNAYAIHGSGSRRVYEALYPTPRGLFTNPDFHRLEFFQQLDISSVSSYMKMNSFSHLWLRSINQNSQQIN